MIIAYKGDFLIHTLFSQASFANILGAEQGCLLLFLGEVSFTLLPQY